MKRSIKHLNADLKFISKHILILRFSSRPASLAELTAGLGPNGMEIVVTSARDSLRNLNLDAELGSSSYPQSMMQTGYSSSRTAYPTQYTFTDSMDSMKMPNLSSFPGRYGNVLISLNPNFWFQNFKIMFSCLGRNHYYRITTEFCVLLETQFFHPLNKKSFKKL